MSHTHTYLNLAPRRRHTHASPSFQFHAGATRTRCTLQSLSRHGQRFAVAHCAASTPRASLSTVLQLPCPSTHRAHPSCFQPHPRLLSSRTSPLRSQTTPFSRALHTRDLVLPSGTGSSLLSPTAPRHYHHPQLLVCANGSTTGRLDHRPLQSSTHAHTRTHPHTLTYSYTVTARAVGAASV